jgi:hypothetical protein
MTSTGTGTNSNEWKAAMCLNSSAVTMIERSCFLQAADTLSDALQVLPGETSPQRREPSHQDLSTMLTNANICLFQPDKLSALPLSIKVVYHDGSIEGSVKDVLKGHKYCVVRVETDDSDCNDISLDEASAVLLHNAAICWLSLARLNEHDTMLAHYHANNGLQLLQKALSTLNNLYAIVDSPFALHRILFLLKITVDALIQCFELVGHVERASTLRRTVLFEVDSAAKEYDGAALFSTAANKIASPAA